VAASWCSDDPAKPKLLFTVIYGLFCSSKRVISPRISNFQPLFPKTPGGGVGRVLSARLGSAYRLPVLPVRTFCP